MTWITDEILFYGGMAVAGCSLLVMLIYLCVSQIGRVRLNAQLDSEYGQKEKTR